MYASCLINRLGIVRLLALGLTTILPATGTLQGRFIKLVSDADSEIVGIDDSGIVTWRHSTGTGNYTVWFARDLSDVEWVPVESGSVSGLVQTCRIPILTFGTFSIAGRLFFSTQTLANHPVELRDPDWNLLQSGLTDANGAYLFKYFADGQYFVATPDTDIYLNNAALVNVDNRNLEDIDIHVPRPIVITQPQDFTTLTAPTPLIAWIGPVGSVSYSIDIRKLPQFYSIENEPVDGDSYQVQQILDDGDYQASIAAYDHAGNPIGRGTVSFSIASDGSGANTVDFNGYMHNNNVRIPNHPIMLLDADGDLVDEQESDGDGYFVFQDVPFGDYQVFVPEHGGYCQDNKPIMVDEELEGYIYNLHLMRRMGFSSPSQNSTVPGDSLLIQWSAVGGATQYYLEIYRNHVFHDDHYTTGTSATRNLPDGAYRVEVMAITSSGLQIGNGTVLFTVGEGDGDGNGDRTMTIFGYLYNHDGERIANHPVKLFDLDWGLIGEQQSDADGKFNFPDLPEQEYEVYCPTHGDYYFGQMRVWDAEHASDELGMPLHWIFQITSPADRSTIQTSDVEIRWQPLARTEMYRVEIIDYDNYSINNYFTTESFYNARDLTDGLYYVSITAFINWTEEAWGSWGTIVGESGRISFTVSTSTP